MRNFIFLLIPLLWAVACTPSKEAVKKPTTLESFLAGSHHTKQYAVNSEVGDKNKLSDRHLESPGSAAFNGYRFDNDWQEAHQVLVKFFSEHEQYDLSGTCRV